MDRNAAQIPHSMADVSDTFGDLVVMQLMQLYGGQDVRFTQKPKPEMIGVMGEEKAIAVCFFLSGLKLYVPHGRIGQRKAEVERLQMDGLQQDQIARALGISTRQVRNLSRSQPKSLPLFADLTDKN
ncbi:MAG: hypothetical protein ABJO27_19205 [Pseudoruegeria sp.]